MPVLPACLLEPIWAQVVVLLPDHPAVAPAHPLGCRRKRIPDRVVFDHGAAALVHGAGDERIAPPGCSDRTMRRRVRAWAEAGAAEQLHATVLAQCDRPIGLDLDEPAAGGCITEAPCGGERAGRSPADRGKRGLKRPALTDAHGIPPRPVSAGANRHDAPLLAPTLAGLEALGPLPDDAAVHLDRGYDGAPTRRPLDGCGITAVIARRGVPAPLQVGGRWAVDRTQSRMNGFGKPRRCTERSGIVVDFDLVLAAAVATTRRPINEARTRFRWDNRPATRGLT